MCRIVEEIELVVDFVEIAASEYPHIVCPEKLEDTWLGTDQTHFPTAMFHASAGSKDPYQVMGGSMSTCLDQQ